MMLRDHHSQKVLGKSDLAPSYQNDGRYCGRRIQCVPSFGKRAALASIGFILVFCGFYWRNTYTPEAYPSTTFKNITSGESWVQFRWGAEWGDLFFKWDDADKDAGDLSLSASSSSPSYASASASYSKNMSLRAVCDLVDHPSKNNDSLRAFQRCMQQLEAAQATIPSAGRCREPQLLLHTVWNGPLHKAPLLGMISAVYAHGPNCVHLIVYTSDNEDSRLHMTESLQPFVGSHVTITPLLLQHIVQQFPTLTLNHSSSVMSDMGRQIDNCPRGLGQAAYSDLIRALVLAAYGGIYLDNDVLVLRQLLPLMHRDFWYRWSTQRYCNTAIFGLTRGSPNALRLVQAVLREFANPLHGNPRHQNPFIAAAKLCHPEVMHQIVADRIDMLPSAYFDPSWVSFDEKQHTIQQYAREHYGLASFGDDFFAAQSAPTSVDQFFPGSFAYHWHGHFGAEFGNNSIAEQFWNRFQHIQETGEYMV